MTELKRRILVFLTIASSSIYIIWRIFRTMPYQYGWLSLIFAIVLLIVEIIGFFEMVVHFSQLSNPLVLDEAPEIEQEAYPDVDIFISTYNEPRELLFKTINACLHMEYPDPTKVHIYLCDDGHREEMGELARELGVIHLVRDTHEHAKAGNLNHALASTNSPLIVTFDADMLPRSTFLMELVPYLVVDEMIGFIQTPQTFYNPDLFQYNLYSEKKAPNEQDYFYRDVQVMRNASNSVIYGGTNTILSRKALVDAGGFYTGVITEDFATGMMIQSKGYQCYALDKPLAVGMAPEDLKSLINQRRRWARGCIQTGRKVGLFFIEGLNLKQKVSYLTSITYWLGSIKRLVYILSPLMYILFNLIIVKTTFLEVLIFWLPMYLLNNYTLRKLSGNIRNIRLTNIYETILFPSLFPVVILELLGISQKRFEVTKKDSKQKLTKQRDFYRFRAILPHIFLAVLCLLGIGISLFRTLQTGSAAYIMVLFWISINLYNLWMSIFFMSGRKANRQFERFQVAVDCLVRVDDLLIRTKTFDISEGGVAIELDFPEWIDPESTATISLYTEKYQAQWEGKIANVFQIGQKWRYGFYVTAIELADWQSFLQIIYDREHTLPKMIVSDYSSSQDFVTNLQKRMFTSTFFSRKLPRIVLNYPMETEAGQEVLLRDFNYQYLTIVFKEEQDVPEYLEVTLGTFALDCVLTEIQVLDAYCYEVVNGKELVSQKLFRPTLQALMANQIDEEQRKLTFASTLKQSLELDGKLKN